MGRKAGLVAVLAFALAPIAPARGGTVAGFLDVPSGNFAETRIRAVAYERDWMRDFGFSAFRPDGFETRRQFAIALVRAFDRNASVDPLITFADVDQSDWAFGAMNVAVSNGWLGAWNGRFRPNDAIKKNEMDLALIHAIGLGDAAKALDGISTESGYRFKVPYAFGAMIIAAEMRLHHNHSQEWREMLPWSPVRRADVAFALWDAASAMDSWRGRSMKRYESIVLPAMTADRGRSVEWALNFAGWPYVWAGEWAYPTPRGYPYGAQPQGGFDCSGFVWWVLKSKSSNYQPGRPDRGWYLPERASYDMGRAAPRRLFSSQLTPMDVIVFDTAGPKDADWRGIDHAGLALGNGWMIHSSGGRGGVSISPVDHGFWKDRFMWGRRVIPGSDPAPPPPPEPTPTPEPSI